MSLKLIKRFLAVLLVLVMSFSLCAVGFNASASKESDLKNEIAKLEKESAAIAAEIKRLKAQKADKVALKNAVQRQITATQAEIDACNSLIVKYKNEIAASEAVIEQKNAEIKDAQERFKKRIRSMYQSNSMNNIQLLLGAESFTDFLMLSKLSRAMTTQDRMLIDKICVAIAEIEVEIEKNKQRQTEQDGVRVKLAEKRKELDQQVSHVNSLISEINSDIKGEQSDKNSIDNQIKEKEEALAEILSGGMAYTGTFNGKFVWPVPGHSFISAYWQSNDSVHNGNHKGIDIAGGNIHGKKVIASASGVIAKIYTGCSHNRPKNGSCGCGGGYGNNIRIDHGKYNGYYYLTIYAHLKGAASGMKKGTSVKQGQTIGYVGSTGWSTNYHLHFGIAKTKNPNKTLNSGWINPLPYVR